MRNSNGHALLRLVVRRPLRLLTALLTGNAGSRSFKTVESPYWALDLTHGLQKRLQYVMTGLGLQEMCDTSNCKITN
jgi:hypothetical protein